MGKRQNKNRVARGGDTGEDRVRNKRRVDGRRHRRSDVRKVEDTVWRSLYQADSDDDFDLVDFDDDFDDEDYDELNFDIDDIR